MSRISVKGTSISGRCGFLILSLLISVIAHAEPDSGNDCKPPSCVIGEPIVVIGQGPLKEFPTPPADPTRPPVVVIGLPPNRGGQEGPKWEDFDCDALQKERVNLSNALKLLRNSEKQLSDLIVDAAREKDTLDRNVDQQRKIVGVQMDLWSTCEESLTLLVESFIPDGGTDPDASGHHHVSQTNKLTTAQQAALNAKKSECAAVRLQVDSESAILASFLRNQGIATAAYQGLLSQRNALDSLIQDDEALQKRLFDATNTCKKKEH